jgi:ABC-2 type transport system ATP-binding protein
MIELQNLVKKFGSFTAVNDLTLKVGAGGKTTTIKMMTGLYAPTSGACIINGHNIQTQPYAAKLQFGYVPDQPYLYEKLTGREFLFFVGGLFNMSGDMVKRKMEEVMDMFEIGDFVDKRADEYSQGMRQRIVLTAALLHDPKVMIIDEPIVGLDPRSARLVKDTLKRKTREGLTVFMSTHLLEIVEELCDRIAIIKDGKIIHEEVQNEQKKFNGQLEAMFLELTK